MIHTDTWNSACCVYQVSYSCMCDVCACMLYVFDFIKGHTYNIQAHISIHMCMYVYVFACMCDIFCVCMCMYEDICCAYKMSLCYIACMCLYFLQPKLLVGRYAQHTGNMHTYIQIQQTYNRHTYTYIQKYMQIHTKIHTPNKCAKSAYAAY